MKKTVGSFALALIFVVTAVAAVHAAAVTNKDVVGEWGLDEAKSKAAPDGNTAGLMKTVKINADGSFEALAGMKGKWALKGGKLVVTWDNSMRSEEPASLDGGYLKFPAPAMAGKFCYLKRAK